LRRAPGLLAAILILGGCVASELRPSPTVPPPTTTTMPQETTTTLSVAAGAARFESCLRAFGIDIDPIPLDAQGRPRLELSLSRADFSSAAGALALEACATHLTTGALGLDGSPLIGQGVLEMLEAFSRCVRSLGVPAFPDPVPDFDGVGAPYEAGSIPFGDPNLPEAADRCRARMGT
jgi:hypothetical protein